MKKLIFTIAFFTACVTAKAQINKDTVGLNLPVKNGEVIYTAVVEVDGKTKDELYRNAQQWFINYFDGAAKFTQDVDKNDAYVCGRGVLKFTSGLRLDANVLWGNDVTIKIECKDNKYRYTFYLMVIKDITDNAEYAIEQISGAVLGTQKWPWSKNAAKNVLIQNDEKLKSAISFLKSDMEKTTTDF
jgi:hypothetical protein